MAERLKRWTWKLKVVGSYPTLELVFFLNYFLFQDV